MVRFAVLARVFGVSFHLEERVKNGGSEGSSDPRTDRPEIARVSHGAEQIALDALLQAALGNEELLASHQLTAKIR